MVILWSLRSTPPIFELYSLINFGCVKFFVCHRPSDLSLLSTWPISKPSGIVDSRWTVFLSFHVQHIRLLLWRKRESPLLSLFTCSFCWSTISLGKNFRLLLTAPEASTCILLLSSSRKQGTLVYQLSTKNRYSLWAYGSVRFRTTRMAKSLLAAGPSLPV